MCLNRHLSGVFWGTERSDSHCGQIKGDLEATKAKSQSLRELSSFLGLCEIPNTRQSSLREQGGVLKDVVPKDGGKSCHELKDRNPEARGGSPARTEVVWYWMETNKGSSRDETRRKTGQEKAERQLIGGGRSN